MDQSEDGQKLEMWLSARNLINTDFIGKSDPRCQVSIRRWNENWQILGTTETIKEDLNPDWKTVFKFDYQFCQHQILAFEIVDVDDRTGDPDDPLGKTYVSVGDLITMKSSKQTVKLYDRSNNPQGELIIHLSKEVPDHQFVSWQWLGKNLSDKDTFTNSDPQITFSRKSKTGVWEEVYKSEVIQNDVDPNWKPFEVGYRQLVGRHGVFKVTVSDVDDDNEYELIGECEITLDDIVNGNKTEFTLIDEDKNSCNGKITINSFLAGVVCVNNIKTRSQESIIDYIFSGLQINLQVAIDFTYSNGNQKQADSLHYISEEPGVQNLYESALESIGYILVSYDSDKLVPLYGFGGVPKFADYNKPYMDECFPLNGNAKDPAVKGVDGILKTYRNSLNFIELSGPTYLNRVLSNAKERALALESKGIYQVLLVLTDGQIEDMNDVIPIIVDCLSVPLSIIIVGIGDENFTNMKSLDDNSQLAQHLKPGQQFRDICQFVAYKDVDNNPVALCKRVLKELQNQFVSYMKIKGIKPKKSI